MNEIRWDASGGSVSPTEEPGVSCLKPFLMTENRRLDGIIQKIKSGKYEFVFRKKKKTKSVSANAYMWVLCDEIARILQSTKDEVYKQAVANVGVFFPLSCESAAFAKACAVWESQGAGFFCNITREQDGRTEFNAYVGSSKYTQEELSRLIEELVAEAENLGIDTKASRECRALIGWKD
nr:MAG TPA: NinB protein [Caudoviricetes sp.]